MYSSRMELVTRGPEETQALGRRLGELMEGGELVLMVGDLGAGKTCLTQGIAWGLGVNEYARSPTFVLVSEYEGRHTLFHADLYRVDDPLEMEDLGLDETYGNGGVCVVEWAEKGESLFPADNLRRRRLRSRVPRSGWSSFGRGVKGTGSCLRGWGRWWGLFARDTGG